MNQVSLKVILTGATGFIGQHVLSALKQKGHEVMILSRSLGHDLFNHHKTTEFLYRNTADVLVHLAWDARPKIYWDNPKNIDFRDASINLFKSFLEAGGKKIIGIGTGAEYPTSTEALYEDMVVNKAELTAYGKAKRECYEWLESSKCDFAWLRIFGIYGKGEASESFFTSAKAAIRLNKEFTIRTPEIFADYIHVEKFSKMLVYLIKMSKVGVLNIGEGVSYSMQTWFEFIKNDYNFSFSNSDKKPGPESRIPNCDKVKKILKNFYRDCEGKGDLKFLI